MSMTEREAIEELHKIRPIGGIIPQKRAEAIEIAINALEKQEKIKEVIENANQWSKEDVIVKAQAFCDIEKILRSDEE